MTVKTAIKRPYDATGRQVAARTTRRRIIDAARTLFLARGYARTTIAAIAEVAGVSVETIYLSVGPKAALVRYLIETALSGTDEPVPALDRPGVTAIQTEPDPRRKVRMFARVVRELLERLAPIWAIVLEAAPGDPELADLVSELRQRHVGTMRLFVEHLASTGALQSDLSIDVAADAVWAMNSPEFFGLLVSGRGWSVARFERWLASVWQRLLLD
ncbi:MAG TPA: helix-turn-helix domain-containing protein [Candidatus Dormibacteraeota bacterium]|nr:helix-turn-helix domain-containing protein [Candidatus Dormibacteraeota bacterium]HEX2680956.1 helix-turn-helix domain-containing protein [Candidatus Dormibacteraeota bacterium]